jgi:hypothetical protein
LDEQLQLLGQVQHQITFLLSIKVEGNRVAVPTNDTLVIQRACPELLKLISTGQSKWSARQIALLIINNELLPFLVPA